jgi:Protein of unknown function (DUF3352)
MAKGSGIAAAMLVAGASGAAGYYYFQTSKNVGDRPEQLAQAIPESAYAVGYIATDPSLWGKLSKFGTPEAKQLVSRSLQQAQKEILSQDNLDYQKDIQPWLGNVMMAIDSSSKAGEFSFLAVSKVKDQIGAYNFLNKVKDKAKTQAKESDYKGAKIWSSGTGKEESHLAYINNWLMVSNSRQSIEKSIDASNGAASFKQKNGDSFFSSDSLSVSNQVVAGYVDFARLVPALNASDTNKTKLTAEQLQQLSDIKSFAGSMGIDDKGVRAKAMTQMNKVAVNLPAASGKVLNSFPANTVMVASGVNLKDLWTEMTKQMATNPKAKDSLSTLQTSFQQSTNLSLDKDVFSWLGGEYALGIVPQKGGFWGDNVGMGMVAIFDSTDKPATERALSGVKNLASSSVGVSERKSVDGKSINEIKNPLGSGPLLSYGWLDDKSVFFSTSEVSTKEPLNKSADFQEIAGSLPQSNSGYIYLNFDQMLTVFDSKALKAKTASIPADFLSILKSIKGLGAAGSQNGNSYRSEGILVLKPSSNGSK